MRCFESEIPKLKANAKTLGGEVWTHDCVEVFIDINHDHKTYFQMVVNSLSVQFDRTGEDLDWSGKWFCSTHVDENEWAVEIKIPFRTLGVKPKVYSLFGFNICHERYAANNH